MKTGDARTSKQSGQGMIEYLLILAVIIGVTVGVMTTITGATAMLVSSVVTNIQLATNATAN